MRVDLVCIADMANIDAGGKLNIVGEFNTILAANLPSPPVNMTLVARITAASSEGNEHEITIVIVDQDGHELVRLPTQQIRFKPVLPGTSGDLRAQIVLGIKGARFPAHGPFRFDILVDGRVVGDRTLFVVPSPGAGQDEPGEGSEDSS